MHMNDDKTLKKNI